MSDQKNGSGGLPGMFPKSSDSIREALPTADEGDALLDMLFDDAPRDDAPVEEPASPALKSTPAPAPISPAPISPAPITPAEAAPAEVVSPPGWPQAVAPRPVPRSSIATLPDPNAEELALATLEEEDGT